jgi:RHS repeat-associated protein
MSDTTGVDAQILTLPKGGGAVQDLGETFDTDLNTGTGSYGLSIAVPTGPNGIRPQLRLRYQTTAGNGPFGIGWTLGTMAIARRTDGGLPTYQPGDDHFVLSGVDDLVDMGDGTFRPRADTFLHRIRRAGDGWELTDIRGTVHKLGMSLGSRIEDMSRPLPRVGVWLLESTQSAGSDPISYSYMSDGAQRYLQHATWGTYRLDLVYETRRDRLFDGCFGFGVETNLRCSRIELHVVGQPASLVRSWNLEYTQAPGSGHSLLSKVTLRGHAADGTTADTPALILDYTSHSLPTMTWIDGVWPDMTPAPFSDGSVELVDWDGDGLPDVLELRNGLARVWPNLGRGRFGVPVPIPNFPGPVTLDQPGVAFADMDGNGVADLLQASGQLARYTPLRPGGGFDHPVTFSHAPTASLNTGAARLVDLNGDGITDVLETGEDFFCLYYRDGADWSAVPRAIPRNEAPPVSFVDPHTRLADMTGDGQQDLVRVDGAGLRYWPYLGDGTWADEVDVENSPTLPIDFEPKRLFLVDVDGDGCADLVYIDTGSVTVWYNQAGRRLSDPSVINYTPATAPENVRLCDFNGTGTLGVLFSAIPDGPNGRGYLYLDLCGGTKPYLLQGIDNGIGLKTTIRYRSSTEYAVDAAEQGVPWSTFHPFPVQCVAGIEVSDTITGETSTVTHKYHAARYDPVHSAFLGFQIVESTTDGDSTIPAQRIVNTFHLGLDPSDLSRPLDADEVLLFGALRRRLLATEIYGLDDSTDAEKPYRVIRHTYASKLVSGVNGSRIAVPYETQTTDENHARTGAPLFVRTVDYLEHDEHWNITKQRMRSGRAGASGLEQDITTEIAFAKNEPAYVVALPARITQHDAAGTLLSAKVMFYDGPAHIGLPEGDVDVGFTTRVEALCLPDSLVQTAYGAQPPDFVALGYHRRPGEDGWWVTTVSYAREPGPPFALVARNPMGAESRSEYDPTRQFIVRLIDALGHITVATADPHWFALSAVTDPNGSTTRDRFDSLGRVTATIGPLDSDALPTTAYSYRSDVTPVAQTTHLLLNHGMPDTADETNYYDGRGRTLCTIISSGAAAAGRYIVSGCSQFNVRGLAAASYEPFAAPDRTFRAPPSATAATRYRYDGLARLVEQIAPSGARTRTIFGPDFTTVSNDVVGGTLTRAITHRHDSLNRVTSVERPLAGLTVSASYEYDGLNRLVAVHDADGGTTRFIFDLFGRMLVQEGVDTGRTTYVFDARGNQLQRRAASGATTTYTVDTLERVLTVRTTSGGPPDVTYTYLNPGDPVPADGMCNRLGRVWKVSDGIGTTQQAYDALGRVIQTRRHVNALNRDFVTDFVLDAVGRQLQTTLPEPVSGAGRRVVRYTFDDRGVPISAPGYVKSAAYDINGRLTSLVLQNDVRTTVEFAPHTTRPSRAQIYAPDGTTLLRDNTYRYDDAGNTVAIESPLDLERARFQYDDFDRLVFAEYGNGDRFAYEYSNANRITRVDGVGDCTTRAPGSGQIASAGASTYTYDADGRLQTAPYGTLAFDADDRLRSIAFSGGSSETYAYDHNGARCYRRAHDGKESYVVTPSLEIVDGTPIVWVTFGWRRVVGFVGNGVVYPHYDSVGNATLFTGSAGNEVRRLAFGPYGTLRHDSAEAPPLDGVRFGGGVRDDRSGLLCLGRRYYDPRIGCFISPDPLAATFALDGWNRYVYARCNPIRYVDPTGMVNGVANVFAIFGLALATLALIIAAAFTDGATLPFAGATAEAAVNVSAGGVLVSAAIGIAGGGIIGGMAASQAGGDVWAGVLFGGLVGAFSGFFGGWLGSGVFAALNATGGLWAGEAAGVVSGMIEMTIAGTSTGAAVGFAGGKGTSEAIFQHMAMGFLAGNITGAALGYIFGAFNATDPKTGLQGRGQVRVFTIQKFLIPSEASTAGERLSFGDNLLSSIQDFMNWAKHGFGAFPNGITEFVQIDQFGAQTAKTVFDVASNKALITIPMGWVATVAFPYGGAIALQDASMIADLSGWTWDQQFATMLNVVPILGVIAGAWQGYGDPGWTDFQKSLRGVTSQNQG